MYCVEVKKLFYSVEHIKAENINLEHIIIRKTRKLLVQQEMLIMIRQM
jgi:hypothetical protein